ncbi:Hint domain-containing protein [Szabonella alba]|uniref:Hint domain-containing protein n=1 Tax=Szabonella alba TaxID=2804194 RepID=A0A8K0XY89_9RHOB|nr:Hint domain-containing protein [Szabonella alba]MBL4915795.1 Hint domain-containing protein [Szabonella alba]
MAVGANLNYQTNASAMNMARTIFGDGVTVTSASYSGPSYSSAIYSNGHLSSGVVPSSSGVILSTGRATDFTQSGGDPNRDSGTSTDTSGANNNSQFNAIAGTRTYDAVWLDASFIPTGNVMSIQFVFSSEEYPEYINSDYNDVVGVWVNGQHVPITVGNGRTSVNNINGTNQENLFVSNTGDQFNTEMDGFTLTMTLTMPVNPGVTNSIRIGIADASDTQYDSNLLIAAGSLQTVVVARDDYVDLFATGSKTVDILANDIRPGNAALVITKINGVPVTVGSVVTLPSGQVVTVNADGTITLQGDGQVEQVSFTYETGLNSGGGPKDTGFVHINSIPCFVAGTMILTPGGEVPVESLCPGDLVVTQDEGPRPLRWIGQRCVAAEGAFAPVEIAAGTFGPHRRLRVSPQHRILVRDSLAELLFGETEVLIAARHLVNGRSVRQRAGGTVDYVHLLFDRHQIVFSEGLATESFLPGTQVADLFEAEAMDEICALFPELDPRTGAGYSPAARRLLRAHEAQLLFSGKPGQARSRPRRQAA